MKITIDTIDLAYADHGIGQPVIFLHAFPLNRTMWEGQIAALLREQRYRLVAPDWRGFGESGIREGMPSTMELFASDIAGLMDALGMQQAVLCGLSMGGYAAMAFYRQYPERVSGLILADTKFEFGLTAKGIVLADEVLTPDSSRFWPSEGYRPGAAQPSFDKQFVRDYLEAVGWNKQPPAPELPENVVRKTQEKYEQALDLLTGPAL